MEDAISQLKLVAIHPLKGCKQHLLRTLHVDQIYYFDNNFKISPDGLCSYKQLNQLPYNFFAPSGRTQEKGHPLININAIVGKNGDGKSSIVELLIRIVNNLSCEIFKEDENYSGQYVKGINAKIYYAYEFYNPQDKASTISSYICIHIRGNDIIITKQTPITDQIELLGINKKFLIDFFYSMVINFSIYAYNVFDFTKEWNNKNNHETCWLHNLFHKNDGYQNPIVLHPFRNKGNIDINTEKELTKSRYLSLLIEPVRSETVNFRLVNDQQIAYSIKCELLEKKSDVGINEKYIKIKEEWRKDVKARRYPPRDKIVFNDLEDKIWSHWVRIFKLDTTYSDKKPKLYQAAKEYLIYKTISISRKYKFYRSILKLEAKNKKVTSGVEFNGALAMLIHQMSNDMSHITLKVRQTVAFLKLHIEKWDVGKIEYKLDELYNLIYPEDRQELIRLKPYNCQLIDLLPPPIFNTEIWLVNKDADMEQANIKKESFSVLSSGEKQLIYSVSSILYHLRNLNSVEEDKQEQLIHYNHVNLILEEVELYFHPEYQRKYIKYLIDCLYSIFLPKINSINITFVTHSPFVLSDIPKDQVLFLEKGYPVYQMQENTFGANIHNLYRNGFFLKEVPIGEFANEKIENLFERIRRNDLTESMLDEIRLIGEPIIRNQLLRQYNEILTPNKLLLQQIEELKEEVKQLKMSTND